MAEIALASIGASVLSVMGAVVTGGTGVLFALIGMSSKTFVEPTASYVLVVRSAMSVLLLTMMRRLMSMRIRR